MALWAVWHVITDVAAALIKEIKPICSFVAVSRLSGAILCGFCLRRKTENIVRLRGTLDPLKRQRKSINVGILYPSNWKMHTFQPFQGRNARGFRLIRRSDHAELALKTKSASTFSGRPMRDHSQKLTEWPSQLKSLFPVIASYTI